MAFSDDFTGTDEDRLDARAGWSVLGSEGEHRALIFSNGLGSRHTGAATGDTGYQCTDQGSADHATIARWSAKTSDIYPAVRLQDNNNFVSGRLYGTGSSGRRLSKRISGVVTDLITGQGALNEWLKVEASGTTIQFFTGGTASTPGTWTQIGTDQTVSNFSTETTQGIVFTNYGAAKFLDAFQAEPLGGGGPTYTLTAAAISLTLTGIATGLKASRKLTAGAGSCSLSGIDTGLKASRLLTAEAQSFTLTGIAATLQASRKLTAQTASYTLTGVAADLVYSPLTGPDYTLTAAAGAFTLTGTGTGLIAARKLAAATGAYTLTGLDVGFTYGAGPTYTLAAAAGAFTWAGIDAGLTAARALPAGVGAFDLTGLPVTLTYSGALALVAPDERIIRVLAEPRVFEVPQEPRIFN